MRCSGYFQVVLYREVMIWIFDGVIYGGYRELNVMNVKVVEFENVVILVFGDVVFQCRCWVL